MRRALTALATLTLLSAGLCGCTSTPPAPQPTHAGPVRVTDTVPAGMDTYRYHAQQVTITIPAGKAKNTALSLSRAVDALATYPVELVTTGGAQPSLVATFTQPVPSKTVAEATAAVDHAVPAALVTTGTRDMVGVKVTAKAPAALGKDFDTATSRALSAAVAGRYTVASHDRDVTVTFVGPGLTPAGLDQLRTTVSAQTGAPLAAVAPHPLT